MRETQFAILMLWNIIDVNIGKLHMPRDLTIIPVSCDDGRPYPIQGDDVVGLTAGQVTIE